MGDTFPRQHVSSGQQVGVPPSLMDVSTYLRDVLATVSPLPPTGELLLEAHGCVLAEDVHCGHPIPMFSHATVDGYAVRSSDAKAGMTLNIVGEVVAGSVDRPTIVEGQTVRVTTGVPLPEGADAVVPYGLVTEDAMSITFSHGRGVTAGQLVCHVGSELAEPGIVIPKGTVLGGKEIGLLAMIGQARAHVHPQVRVGVISVGSELSAPSEGLQYGKIWDANTTMLAGMVRECGGVPRRNPPVEDNPEKLQNAFRDALTAIDMLIVAGGTSSSRNDYTRRVLGRMGSIRSVDVGMDPGSTQAFGDIDGIPVFAIPGSPVAAAVSFEILVRPALRLKQGHSGWSRPRVTARLAAPVTSPRNHVSFARVRLHRDTGGWVATPVGKQGASALLGFVQSDGLAEIPAKVGRLDAGDSATVHWLKS